MVGRQGWVVLVALSGCLVSIDKSLIADNDAGSDTAGDLASDVITPEVDTGADTRQPDQVDSDAVVDAADDLPTDGLSPDVPCPNLSCELGCNIAEDRCNRLMPSNFSATGFFDTVSALLQIKSGAEGIVDTDDGSIVVDGNVLRPAGAGVVNGIYWEKIAQAQGYPELAVFGMTSLQLAASATLTVRGAASLALYVTQSAAIDGTIITLPNGELPASGGYPGGGNADDGEDCFGGQGGGGKWSTQWDSGGGGAGRNAPGGSGGDNDKTTGGTGGASNGNESLIPLYGGCGGGGGAGPMQGAPGGGGGGAVQISVNGTLTVASQGVIGVPGAGGQGGDGGGGGGGGSGGAILLEATSITLNGTLVANGGSGGCGGVNATGGSNGGFSTSAAAGCSSLAGGSGGSGGALGNEQGSPGVYHEIDGGGGGGAAGRIRLNAATVSVMGGLSPAPTKGTPVGTW